MSKIRNMAGVLSIAKEVYKNKEAWANEAKRKNTQFHGGENTNEFQVQGSLWSRMMTAIRQGNYKFPLKTLVYIGVGLLYFISPIDFIPDFFIGIGLIDDITVLAFVVKRVFKEISHFKQWENRVKNEKSLIRVS